MKFCADSSLIVRLYGPDKPAEAKLIHSYLSNDPKVISISELCRVEVVNVLLRNAQPEIAKTFEGDLKEGSRLRLEAVDWPDIFQRAESLARRFSSTFRPGTHDLIIIAAATAMGASWFLSLDYNSHQRPLASAAGLRVWPELLKDEQGLVRRAAQQAN